jgi:hypothetical protein
MTSFQDAVQSVVAETQVAGRHPEVDTALLTLYTNSVPFGLAALLLNPLLMTDVSSWDEEVMVAKLIDLVVPRQVPD